ncbi:MAG TPA: hypothetical protein VLE03_09970 [Nitrospiraceae bacterium]|nr:hypothetical protein [Nitrospiraceae bacterium]
MFAVAGGPSYAGSPLTWSLLFARQPEPDLEFTEEELEQTTNVRSSSPMKSPKKSGGRPLLWILLLALVGGGAYVAMEPEMITDLLGPILGESPMPSPQPPVAMKPGPSMPAPGAPVGQPGAPAPTPVAPAVPTPQAAAPVPTPTPVPTPAPGMPTASVPTPAPAPMSPPTPAGAVPPVTASVNPMFSEGQRVTVTLNPATPGDTVTLMQDAAGTRPGPAIPPGTTLTILDGELQSSGWVYSVRSDFGTKGWVAEKQLRLKP